MVLGHLPKNYLESDPESLQGGPRDRHFMQVSQDPNSSPLADSLTCNLLESLMQAHRHQPSVWQVVSTQWMFMK